MRILIKPFAPPSFKINLLFLFVILGTFYIYSGVLTGPFIWDDEHFVLRNPSIRSIEKLPEYFTSKETYAMEGDFAIYRPLRNVSYLIDYILFGLNPLGFHAVNLLLHIQNIVLMAYLVKLMTGRNFIPIVAATLFAFHPVQTEAVSWIKGRDDLICTFFYLASLALYIKGRDKKSYLYWGSVISFALALFSKEAALTLPLIILLYNLHFPKKDDTKTSYHPYMYIILLYLLFRTIVVGRVGQTDYWGGSFISAFYTNWTGMVYYLKLLFFPVNLCADYLMFPVRTTLFDPYVLGALFIIVLFLGIAVLSFIKGRRMLSLSIFWFFIALLPVSNMVPIQIIIAERFLYLPSIGIFIGSAVFLCDLGDRLQKRQWIIVFLLSVIAIFLASMTVDRNHVWTDEHLFWSDVATKSPGNTRAWHNLASKYQNEGNIPEAISLYQKALMMEYHSPETHYQLGRIYRGEGDEEKALSEFYAALKDDPENSDINYEIGNLMSKKGWYSDAIFQYKKALESNPDHEDALYDLGIVYMKQKDYGLAAMQFKKLLIIVPENKMAVGFIEYCERMEREG
ncbi:MAG: tetratricopeptide repeat protein [Deltaproteobacteria bacterium]|nr:tetratricopeptide repeat protein [Deltaproteobacteria bacterium]